MIESKDNQIVKHINKLKHKKDRKIHGEYIIEGEKIVNEAIEKHRDYLKEIIVSESYAKRNNIDPNSVILVDEIFDYVTEHKNPEGIIGIMKKKETNNSPDYTKNLIIVLNEVQDPGNLGNIIRTVDSLDLGQIILSENTVDPYMPKVVRSTMGSSFRVNIFEEEIKEVLEELEENSYEIYSAVLDEDSENLYKLDTRNKKIAVIFGNESSGVDPLIQDKTKKLYIPMPGETESLNVSTSVAVVSYEIYRQNL